MAVVEDTDYNGMKEVKEVDKSKKGVKGLDLKASAASAELQAPIIDLSRGSQIVDEVKEACRTWGFFQVVNHGIPIQVMEETIEAIRSFHEQPIEMKEHYMISDGKVLFLTNKNNQWSSDLRLSFINSIEWESVPMVCRKELEMWGKELNRLGETLKKLFCEGLGVSEGRLKELSCLEPRAMSCHYYPYCPQRDRTLGLKSHTDKLLFTLLMRSDSGLQVKHGGDRVDHHHVHDAITVNVGDLLQILSNDEYKSVEHRVLANPTRNPTVSAVVFFGPGKNGETDYHGPLPELLSSAKPAMYKKFTMPEFYKEATKTVAGKIMINFFKLPDVAKEKHSINSN